MNRQADLRAAEGWLACADASLARAAADVSDDEALPDIRERLDAVMEDLRALTVRAEAG